MHMWMATGDDGLAATLYGPSTLSALAGPRVPVRVTTTTDYPFDESIRMKIEPKEDVQFPLYVRIPGWCKQAEIRVNGTPLPTRPDDKGFVKIARTWCGGDMIEMKFRMAAADSPAVSKASFPPLTAVISVSSRRPSSSPGDCPMRAFSMAPCSSPFRFPTSIPTRR